MVYTKVCRFNAAGTVTSLFSETEVNTWWRHQMEIFSALLAFCVGNSAVTGWFPLTKASDVDLWRFLWLAPEQTAE